MRAPILVGVLLVLEGCSGSPGLHAPRLLPNAAREVLASPDRFELLSLHPLIPKEPPEQAFHGWKVLGRGVIPEQSRQQELVLALEKGIAESGPMALCFEPRHGIRATSGAVSIDLVICFQCFQIEVYGGSGVLGTVSTTRSPEPIFDRVLDAAGIPRAPKAAQ